MLKKILFIIPFGAILFFGVIAAGLNTLTYDEATHFRNAEKFWQFDTGRHDFNATMPINAVHVIPSKIEAAIAQATGFSFYGWVIQKSGMATLSQEELKIYSGRLVNLIFSLLLALLIFRWTRELYGDNSAVVTLWLYAFTPTFLALGPIANSDVAISFFCALSFYIFWKCFKHLTVFTLVMLGISLGLAQISKYHAVFIPFIFLLILLIRYLFKFKELSAPKTWTKFLGCAVLVAVITVLVINTAYLWNAVGKQLKAVEFQSESFKKLGAVLGPVPVPLALPFYQGLDFVADQSEDGSSHYPIYLLGERSPSGFKGYYAIAFGLKETIPFILFSIAALLSLLFVRSRWRTFLDNEIFLIVPFLFFWIFCNFFTTMQTGIRYLLPAYPFLIIFIGSLFQNPELWKKIQFKIPVLGLLAWHVISPLTYTPNYLSYFNELIGSRLNAYRYLADSNLCWGQNGFWLKSYLKRHPDARVDPLTPTSGLVVVDVNRLLGLADPPEAFAWIREHYQPVGHVSHAHLVFRIPETETQKNLSQ